MMLQIRIYVALSVKLRHISGMFETIGWRNVPGVEHRETQELDFKSMIQRVLLATHFLPSSLNHSLPFTRTVVESQKCLLGQCPGESSS